jgi:hypothetical protein
MEISGEEQGRTPLYFPPLITFQVLFRSLYPYARAKQRDPQVELIPFLVQFHQSLGLVKAKRKRQCQKEAQTLDIWAKSLT